MKIFFVTSNAAKVGLANERLGRYGVVVEQVVAETLGPQTIDVEEVALYKTEQLKSTLKSPFIVEDSGLYIDQLNGFPGALLEPVLDAVGAGRLIKMLDDNDIRQAFVKSVLVYCDPQKDLIRSFTCVYKGSIADTERGSETRGWKVSGIFVPGTFDKTLAEMDENEWQKFLDDFRSGDHYEKFGKWVMQGME